VARGMYQVTALQVMDHMMVQVKVFTSETGHWELLAERQMLVSHELDDDLGNDLATIARAIQLAATQAQGR